MSKEDFYQKYGKNKNPAVFLIEKKYFNVKPATIMSNSNQNNANFIASALKNIIGQITFISSCKKYSLIAVCLSRSFDSATLPAAKPIRM